VHFIVIFFIGQLRSTSLLPLSIVNKFDEGGILIYSCGKSFVNSTKHAQRPLKFWREKHERDNVLTAGFRSSYYKRISQMD
jgi:hypothetical protein